MIKLDIINEVVNKTGITKTKAELAVETVFESMKKALTKGDRIELRGFGVFNVRPRKTGIGRNPRTGAEVSIPPGKAVRFKPGKELQSIDYARPMNKWRQHFRSRSAQARRLRTRHARGRLYGVPHVTGAAGVRLAYRPKQACRIPLLR